VCLFPNSRQVGFLLTKDAVAFYGVAICTCVIISHTLTYAILNSGHGFERNPMALATLWMGPVLNLAIWGGFMAGLAVFMWSKFEKNRSVVLVVMLPLFVFCLADAANDMIVAFQCGLFG